MDSSQPGEVYTPSLCVRAGTLALIQKHHVGPGHRRRQAVQTALCPHGTRGPKLSAGRAVRSRTFKVSILSDPSPVAAREGAARRAGRFEGRAAMKTAILALATALSCAFVAPVRATTWTVQTSPTAVSLNGVASSDANTWIVVGDAGTIIRSTDGGFNWSVVTSPVADQLHAVAFRDTLGLAVGVGGRVLRSTDRGAHWTEIARPTTKILFAAAISDSFAVLTGEEGRIFVSTDQGVTWAPHFAGTASALFGVAAKGDGAIGAGGAGAVIMSPGRGSARG